MKNRTILITALWLLVLFFLGLTFFSQQRRQAATLSREAFLEQAEITDQETVTQANIWLKHTVHGTEGIRYRYVVETDCPSYDFESRYVTDTPLSWVGETSAVEVFVHTVQVTLPGTDQEIYASGEYYLVPILDNLSSENISFEEWKDNLMTSAYNTYLAGQEAHDPFMMALLTLTVAIPLIYAFAGRKKKPV